MTGVIALAGGGPFVANDDLDRRLLAAAGADRVVVLPTADAFEEPAALVRSSMAWAERMGVVPEALMVLQRHDAEDEGAADVVRGARAVWLVGDSSMHLRSTLKETPVLAALDVVLAAGGVVGRRRFQRRGAVRPDARSARRRLHPRPRPGRAASPSSPAWRTWSEERRHRTLTLANTPVVELPTGSALLRGVTGWELVGEPVVHGDLP